MNPPLNIFLLSQQLQRPEAEQMTKVMQKGRSDCRPYTLTGEKKLDQFHELWNRTDQNTLQEGGRKGRNTLCHLMLLGCKVLPFSI